VDEQAKGDDYFDFVDVLIAADIRTPVDLVGIPSFAFDDKVPSTGKRGFITRAIQAATKEFAVESASATAKPAVADEILNIFKKDPVKVVL